VHVSETLNVAVRSLDAMQHHRERFHTANDLVRDSNACKRWDKVGSRFEFQLRFLEGLLQRSEANNARIQNEITLVSSAYKERYAIGHQAHNIRLSMLQPKETAGSSCR
jgi:hypothetical protein